MVSHCLMELGHQPGPQIGRLPSTPASTASSRHVSAQAALLTKGYGIGCSDSFIQNVLVGASLVLGVSSGKWNIKISALGSFPYMGEIKLSLIHIHANILGGWFVFTLKCVCLCVNQQANLFHSRSAFGFILNKSFWHFHCLIALSLWDTWMSGG